MNLTEELGLKGEEKEVGAEELSPDIDITFRSFVHEPLPVPDPVVPGLGHPGSMILFGGPSKSFKTWSLINAAAAWATGTSWWGFEAGDPKRVMYLDWECPDFVFSSRANAVTTLFDDGQMPLLEENSCWLSSRGLGRTPFGFDSKGVPERLIEEIQARAIDIVIFEPLYFATVSRDTNSEQEVLPMLQSLRALADKTGAAIVLSDHFNKSASNENHFDRLAGSGVKARYADSIMTISRTKASDTFMVETTTRALKGRDPFCVKFEYPGFSVVTPEETEKAAPLSSDEEHVRAVLAEGGSMKIDEVRKGVSPRGTTPANVTKALAKLEVRGLAKLDGEKWKLVTEQD